MSVDGLGASGLPPNHHLPAAAGSLPQARCRMQCVDRPEGQIETSTATHLVIDSMSYDLLELPGLPRVPRYTERRVRIDAITVDTTDTGGMTGSGAKGYPLLIPASGDIHYMYLPPLDQDTLLASLRPRQHLVLSESQMQLLGRFPPELQHHQRVPSDDCLAAHYRYRTARARS